MGEELFSKAYYDSLMTQSIEDTKTDSSQLRLQVRKRRRSFLVFVRIIIKCLEQSDDKHAAYEVKKVVTECIKSYRQGQLGCQCLVDIIEMRLQTAVEKNTWEEATEYLRKYHEWKASNSKVQSSHRGGDFHAPTKMHMAVAE